MYLCNILFNKWDILVTSGRSQDASSQVVYVTVNEWFMNGKSQKSKIGWFTHICNINQAPWNWNSNHMLIQIKRKLKKKTTHNIIEPDMIWICWYLGEISIFEVCSGHAVQPGSPQFRGAGVRAGQAVLEVQQHLGVLLVFLHLGRGHQHCSDALGQTLHFGGESCGLDCAERSSTLLKNKSPTTKIQPGHLFPVIIFSLSLVLLQSTTLPCILKHLDSRIQKQVKSNHSSHRPDILSSVLPSIFFLNQFNVIISSLGNKDFLFQRE